MTSQLHTRDNAARCPQCGSLWVQLSASPPSRHHERRQIPAGRVFERLQIKLELERLAAETGTRLFPPIVDLASLASFRMDAHPYAPLATAVEEVLLGALV